MSARALRLEESLYWSRRSSADLMESVRDSVGLLIPTKYAQPAEKLCAPALARVASHRREHVGDAAENFQGHGPRTRRRRFRAAGGELFVVLVDESPRRP